MVPVVKVPVLSVHITVALPKVSTTGNFLTITFFLAMTLMPIANAMVTTAGSPSGIAATAKDTDILKSSSIKSASKLPQALMISKTKISTQRCIHPFHLLDQPGDLADLSFHAGCSNYYCCPTSLNHRAHVNHIGPFGQR